MSTTRWSVRLAFEGRITNELMNAMVGAGFRVRMHYAEFDPGSEQTGEPTSVTIELDAIDAREARVLGIHLLGQAQDAARMKRDASPVWVVPLQDAEKSSMRHLRRAKELFDEDDFDMAVVAAQIHLEVQTTTLVQHALRSDPSPLVSVFATGRRGWAPHDPIARRVLDAVLGIRITDFPRWNEYQAHVARRNDVIHAGLPVDAESAKDSLEVTSELWLWLNAAAQRIAA